METFLKTRPLEERYPCTVFPECEPRQGDNAGLGGDEVPADYKYRWKHSSLLTGIRVRPNNECRHQWVGRTLPHRPNGEWVALLNIFFCVSFTSFLSLFGRRATHSRETKELSSSRPEPSQLLFCLRRWSWSCLQRHSDEAWS